MRRNNSNIVIGILILKLIFSYWSYIYHCGLMLHYLILNSIGVILYFIGLQSYIIIWYELLLHIILLSYAFIKHCVEVEIKRKTSSYWWTLDGWEFEEEVAKVLKKNGYRKVTVTKGSGDGGVDIIFYNGFTKIIGQCKHYRNPVPPEPVRALWGVKDDFHADKVVMIASNGVTKMSKDFIDNKKDYLLWTLDDIIRMAKGED